MDLTSYLGIQHPILLAPMAGVSTPQLAATVSNQGGLGALGLGSSTLDHAIEQIKHTKQLTKKPFQLNFFCHKEFDLDIEKEKVWIEFLSKEFSRLGKSPPNQLNKLYSSFTNNEDFTNMVLDIKPRAISFHFGLPSKKQIAALKSAGIITMVSITQLSEALEAQSYGIDILIAQGIEAGGHRGIFNENNDPAIFTKDLVQALIKNPAVTLPIVAAGGLMTGKDIREIIDLGASAAQLGTAFLTCAESAANQNYKKALLESNYTQITRSISGRPARGLFSHWHTDIDILEKPEDPGYPFTYDIAKQLNMLDPINFPIYWAGCNVSKIRPLDASVLMQTLISEMN